MSKADDLLRRALDCWDFNDDPYFDDVNGIMQEIRAYLDAPKDDLDWDSKIGADILFAGWLTTRDKVISCGATENASLMAQAIDEYKAEFPERFHPPTKTAPKQPMTEEEIAKEWADNDVCCYGSFESGIRFVENFHGIGGGE